MSHRSPPVRRVPPVWDFREYDQRLWTPGRSWVVQAVWTIVSKIVFESGWFPLYAVKRSLLRLFGGTIGKRVVIKPKVRIKFPWRLTIEDDVWIGQDVWIDNLECVYIETQCCLSQAVYLCTGSHDYRSRDFGLHCEPIRIRHHGWVCARATVLAGTVTPPGCLVMAGRTISQRDFPATDCEPKPELSVPASPAQNAVED